MESQQPWSIKGTMLLDFNGNTVAIFNELEDAQMIQELFSTVEDLQLQLDKFKDTFDTIKATIE